MLCIISYDSWDCIKTFDFLVKEKFLMPKENLKYQKRKYYSDMPNEHVISYNFHI